MCCSPWGHKSWTWLSDWTELNWTDLPSQIPLPTYYPPFSTETSTIWFLLHKTKAYYFSEIAVSKVTYGPLVSKPKYSLKFLSIWPVLALDWIHNSLVSKHFPPLLTYWCYFLLYLLLWLWGHSWIYVILSLVSCLQCGRPRFNPRVRNILWRRKWQPTPVLLPGKSHAQRSVVGYSPWGSQRVGHNWTTSLSLFISFSCYILDPLFYFFILLVHSLNRLIHMLTQMSISSQLIILAHSTLLIFWFV